MKPKSRASFTFLLLYAACLGAAPMPREWQHEQLVNVPTPGLIKLSLPIDTLNAARPGLEDLRVIDDAGSEIPYTIENPVSTPALSQRAKSFQSTLDATSTVIAVETGLVQPLNAITLESPSPHFLKGVQIETSSDGRNWSVLQRGTPIFRQFNSASQLTITVPPAIHPWLRLTIDDQRSAPVPFTGAIVHAGAVSGRGIPLESLPIIISERHENPGETRLTLNLGAANLKLANLEFETTEPLFTRQVNLAVSQFTEDSLRERELGTGTIYRVALEGQPASASLTVRLETQVTSRDLIAIIKNQDSPPLPITAVRATRHPIYLILFARQTGPLHLLTGNPGVHAPRYDLAALGDRLKAPSLSDLPISPLAINPAYVPPEVLAGIPDGSTPLDVSKWSFRKPVKISRAGPQSLELDLDVLSREQSGLHDLRLLRGSNQLPYIIERTSILRSLTPTLTLTNDTKNPRLSRWIIKLPNPGLPVTRLLCHITTPLFQRELSLYETVTDERGEKYRRPLGQASWIRTPDRKGDEFSLPIDSSPQTDTLYLETDNGDNSALQLEKLQLFHPATRVLFKAKPEESIYLYYGNVQASPPRYDLSLVADQLLTADKAKAGFAPEERLKKSSSREGQNPGSGGIILWSALALVVIVLLTLISKLLPKA